MFSGGPTPMRKKPLTDGPSNEEREAMLVVFSNVISFFVLVGAIRAVPFVLKQLNN